MNLRMKKRDTFIFYRSIFESAQVLPSDERLAFYEAVMKYSMDFEEPVLDGVAAALFILLKPTLSKSNTQFINGSKPKRKPTRSQNEADPKPNANNKDKDKDKDKDKAIEKDKEKVLREKFPQLNIKAFNLWIDYKGKSYSKRAQTLSINKLIKQDQHIQFQMVEESVMNSWKGLFEPKQQKQSKQSNQIIDDFFSKQDAEVIDAE